ncbi:hypothetical protein [Conexibacter woesei]|uniref:hypothetical protein n=1 Tax=Conexibacter woesei TaxID=191495 RepID=UPI00041CAE0E|nr:hypothetical protein [Conexibacter woesei]
MMVTRRRTAALPLTTAAALAWAAAAPTSAPAASVTLWACHGPAGQALGVPPLVASTGGDGVIGQVGAGCAGPGDGGVRATFTRPDPSGGSFARWRLDVPAGVAVSGVRLARSVFGDFGGTTLEDGGAAFGVRCEAAPDARCAASSVPGIDVSSVQVDVVDDAAPRGAVGGVVSPAAGKLSLSVRATDAGLGLARATALLDGAEVASTDLGGASCADLSPGDAHVDLPVTAACPVTVPDAALSVDTTTVPDGPHRLAVVVTDAAGQATTILDQDVVVANAPVLTSNTATLAIGNGSPVSGAGGPGSSTGDGGGSGSGTGGAGAAACARPELSMFLRQRPLRVSRGTAVLRRNGRYRFGGTLTCLVNRKRKPAKAGLLIDIINKVGTHSLLKGGTATGPGGTISVILAYPSSRMLTFRYRGTDGTTARVSIKLLVRKAAR